MMDGGRRLNPHLELERFAAGLDRPKELGLAVGEEELKIKVRLSDTSRQNIASRGRRIAFPPARSPRDPVPANEGVTVFDVFAAIGKSAVGKVSDGASW